MTPGSGIVISNLDTSVWKFNYGSDKMDDFDMYFIVDESYKVKIANELSEKLNKNVYCVEFSKSIFPEEFKKQIQKKLEILNLQNLYVYQFDEFNTSFQADDLGLFSARSKKSLLDR
jgi:hypothetical protein